MRAVFLAGLAALLSAPVVAAEQADQLDVCHSYGDLAYQTFQARDQGISAQDQLKKWEAIPDTVSNRQFYIARASTIMDFAYGAYRGKTPQEARVAFFQGCAKTAPGNRVTPNPIKAN